MYGTGFESKLGILRSKSQSGVITTSAPIKFEKSWSRTGSTTPLYRKKLDAGSRIPPLAYKYMELETCYGQGRSGDLHRPSGLRSESWGCMQRETAGQAPTVIPPSAAQLQASRSRVITDVLLKLKDQKVNVAQMFAERIQTVNLMSEAALKVVSAISYLRKGMIRDAALVFGIAISNRSVKRYTRRFKRDNQLDNVVTSGWLQLQYGWKPLLNDVYGSAELIAQKTVREVIGRVESRKTVEYNDKNRWVDSFWTYDRRQKTKITRKVVLYFAVDSEALHTTKQVGLTNPLLIAWELMPWSFVIDWFIPFGNYLSSLDATLGTSFLSGTESTTIEVKAQLDANVSTFVLGDYNLYGSVSGSSRRQFTHERVVLTTFPSVHFPSFKNPLSLEHGLNALALLKQLTKK